MLLGIAAPTAVARAQAPVAADSATTTTPRTLPTLTVEANRRRERADQVPISATVLDAATLRDARVLGLRQIETYAPNVAVTSLGQIGGSFITIRGLESNPFIVNRVATYIDGIPFRAFDNPLLTDAAQIEILRGPQGTLYGANADAGLVILRTRDPGFTTQAEVGTAVQTFGTGSSVLGTARISGKLGSTLAGSVASQFEGGDSYVRNPASRAGLRGALGNAQLVSKLRWLAGTAWRVDALVLGTRLRAPGLYEQEFAPLDRAVYDARYGAVNGTGIARFGLLHDAPKRTSEDELAAGLSATHFLPGATLTLAASQRAEWNDSFGTDLDLTAAPLAAGGTRRRNRFTNLEARLTSAEDARVAWVAGVTGYAERRRQVLSTLVGPGDFADYAAAPQQESRAFDLAAYGQVTAPLASSVRLTLGLRGERARRRQAQEAGSLDLGPAGRFEFDAVDAARTFTALVPRAALDWAPTERVLVYGSVARGWLPGGFNLEATRSDQTRNRTEYGNENLWTTEAGLRWRSADDRVALSAALFRTDASRWLEYNVLTDASGAAVSTNLITNDAAVTTQGAELEARAQPVPGLLLTAGAGFTDATYDRYRFTPQTDFSGNRVKLVPRFTSNVTATARPGGGLFLRGEVAARGRMALNPENTAFQGRVALLNAQAGWESPMVTLRLFASNLTNRRIAAGQAFTNFLFGADGTFYTPLAPQRIVGLSIEWRPTR